MHLEPEEVEQERQHDQAGSTSNKVLSEVGEAESATRTLNIQQFPEVDDDGRSDGDKCEQTNVLGGDIAGQSEASEDQPLPPLAAEGFMAALVELDVEQQATSHSENQGGIQKNQAGLSNVCVVEENETGSNESSRDAVARFPHNQVCNGNSQGTENRR